VFRQISAMSAEVVMSNFVRLLSNCKTLNGE
jgi:hypothetical protein